MIEKTALDALRAADAIREANRVLQDLNGADCAIALPSDDGGMQVVDVEEYAEFRRRKRAIMQTAYLQSYADYIRDAHTGEAATFVNAADMTSQTILDYGTTDTPRHCDDIARLRIDPTVEYAALRKIIDVPQKQRAMAEFFEDWAPHITCVDANDAFIKTGLAISAIRRITIESARKGESAVESLSESRSTFESVTASSTAGLPARVIFNCTPYLDFEPRSFEMRLSISTGGDDPAITLRSIRLAVTQKEIAEEFARRVADALNGSNIPVFAGTYKAQ